ncbi:MAG: adenylate/guanylate cyclase domain-containing protein [Dehalococcoidia bacterium]
MRRSTVESRSRELLPYLPQLLIEWQREDPDASVRELDGTLIFADISGFTAMSERLSRKGKVGAEEVTDIINDVFSELLSFAWDCGGGLVKFGGDALVIFFAGEAHASRACHAAFGMRRTLRRIGRIKTSAGTVVLRLSIGVHSGSFHFFLAGDSHRELIIAGPAATRTVEMESAAQAGEILISADTAALVPPACSGDAKGPGVLLARAPALIAVGAKQIKPSRRFDAAFFVPVALREHLAQGELSAEHRQVTVAFVHFTSVDEVLAEQGAFETQQRLHALVTSAQEAAAEYGVCFLASDVAGNGGKIILTGGAPLSTGADEDAVLQTARRIADGDYGLDLHIGVNRGHVFTGAVGPPFRRTYTIIGDDVNLAARVMARAEPGQVLATDTVLERAHVVFETVALEPFRVKGKSQPVNAFAIGSAQGSRERYESHTLPFVGRETEVAGLCDAADAALRGHGRVLELIGDAGIGKSRLLEELRRQRPDLRYVNAACEQYESSTAYFSFRALIRRLLDIDEAADASTEGKQLTRAVRKVAPDLAPWLPLLATLIDATVPSTKQVNDIEPQFRKARLHQVATDLLSRLLPEPSAIVIEDIHWADEASLDLLRDLARETPARPWLLLATSRPLPQQLIVTEAGGTAIRLAPLTREDTTRLVRSATAALDLSQHEVATIAHRAGGNPLFLAELVAATESGSDAEALPDSVEAVITARIDRLSANARRLLRYASVAGPTIDLELLRELTPTDLRNALGPAARRELGELAVVDRSALRFNHALFRDVAYEGLPFRERRRLHGRLGSVLEARAGGAADELAELLSLHFYHADERDKAWRYSLLAGQRSQQKSANVEAAGFYERALTVGRGASLPATELASVSEALGDVCELAAVYDKAAAAYRQAKRYFRGDPAKRPALLLKEGVIRERFGRYSQALRFYSAGMKDEYGGEGVRLRIAYAGVRYRQGKYAECARWCREVIPQAEAAGDRAGLAHAYYLLDHALTFLRTPDKPDYSAMALAIYEDLGDLVRQANVLNNVGIEAYFRGDWQRSMDCYQRSREARARAGDVVGEATQENNIAEILSDQGRLDEAEALFQEALRTWRAARYPIGIALAISNLGRLAGRRGALSQALELLREAHGRFEEIGATAFVLEADARVAESLVLSGQPDKALLTTERTLSRLVPGTEVLQAMVHRVRGYALLQSGRHEDAHAELETSLKVARTAGADYETALTLEALSHAARLTGHGNATALVIEAWKIFERLDVESTPRVPLPNATRDTEAVPHVTGADANAFSVEGHVPPAAG